MPLFLSKIRRLGFLYQPSIAISSGSSGGGWVVSFCLCLLLCSFVSSSSHWPRVSQPAAREVVLAALGRRWTALKFSPLELNYFLGYLKYMIRYKSR